MHKSVVTQFTGGMFVASGLLFTMLPAGCDDPGDEGAFEAAALAEENGDSSLALAVTKEEAEAQVELARDELVAPGGDPAALTLLGAGFAHVLSTGALDGGAAGAWNSTGGGVTATKLSTGRYWVFWNGFNGTLANAQVVAYGVGSTATHCKLDGALTGSATLASAIIKCYDSAGTAVDSAFKIYVDSRSGTGDIGAYLLSSSTGTVTREWNSTTASAGANTVVRTSAGEYTATLTGQTVINVGIHVTAADTSANRCAVKGWGPNTVNIRCYNSAGALADTAFYLDRKTVTMLDLFSGSSTIGAHAWISSGTPQATWTEEIGNCPQNPDPVLTAAASGNDIILSLPAAEFPGGGASAKYNVLPMVSAYGTTGDQCAVRTWTVDVNGKADVTVRCFNSAGTQINANTAKFTFSISNEFTPFC